MKAKGGRELLEQGSFEIRHPAGRWMLADVATKALAAQRHRELVQLMSMSEPSGTDGGELQAVVSKLRGAGRQDPLSSSESPQVAGSSAMAGLRLLVIAAVLTEAASKWIITVERRMRIMGTKSDSWSVRR